MKKFTMLFLTILVLFCTLKSQVYDLTCRDENLEQRFLNLDSQRPFIYNKELSQQPKLAPSIVEGTQISSSSCPTDWTETKQLSTTGGNIPLIATQGDNYVHLTWWYTPIGLRLPYVRSTDGGRTFNEVRDMIDGDSLFPFVRSQTICASERLVYFFFIDNNVQIAGHPMPIWMIRSNTHGDSWENPHSILPYDSAYQIDQAVAFGDTIVLVYSSKRFGMWRRLLYSTNSGSTWNIQKKRLPPGYDHRIAITPGVIHIVYEKWGPGRKYRGGETMYSSSTNFGRTWRRAKLLSIAEGYSSIDPAIAATPDGRLYVCWRDGRLGSANGVSGSICLRSSFNNGKSWNPELVLTEKPSGIVNDISVFGNIVSVAWVKDTSGMFVGGGYRIISRSSTDGAVSWCPLLDLTPTSDWAINPTVKVSPSRVQIAWVEDIIIGSGNFQIFHRSVQTTPSEIQNNIISISDEEQKYDFLFQNYPNPFNPITTFSFELVEKSVVSLKVYNILGQSVSTILEDTELDAGEHEYFFDGSALPSGIYYYRLSVRDVETGLYLYTVTKKCILIK